MEEIISTGDFVNKLWNPLRKNLLEKGFIEGKLFKKKSREGRYEYYPISTNFHYLLLCKGVPLKIQNQFFVSPHEIRTIPAIFRTTKASVDSELSLIVTKNNSLISSIPNPLFQINNPNQLDFTNVISVCRLDAPTYAAANKIVDLSIEAEKNDFIAGRAYVDLHPQHPDGNQWLKAAAAKLTNFGYDVDVELSEKHWNITQRYDAPGIYFGWYKDEASGPAVDKNNPLPPGSIAAHIHSFSAKTLSNKNAGWVGPLIEKGYAVSFGNVSEPYLQLTLRPDLFIQSLLKGACVGEASLFANPVLSWQNITIGDPLYTPFSKNPSKTPLEILNNPSTNPYTAIVYINRLAKKYPYEAKEKAIDYFIKSPNVPIAYKILNDFSDITSDIFKNSLYEYVCHKQMVVENMVPLFLNLFDQLHSSKDTRAILILENLENHQKNWSEPTIESIAKKRQRIQ